MQISTGKFLICSFFEKRIRPLFCRNSNGIASPCLSVMKEAEANKLKLTPQFLELKFIEAIADNTKIFFGEKVGLSVYASVCMCIHCRVYNLYLVIHLPCRYLIWFWIKGCLGTSCNRCLEMCQGRWPTKSRSEGKFWLINAFNMIVIWVVLSQANYIVRKGKAKHWLILSYGSIFR